MSDRRVVALSNTFNLPEAQSSVWGLPETLRHQSLVRRKESDKHANESALHAHLPDVDLSARSPMRSSSQISDGLPRGRNNV